MEDTVIGGYEPDRVALRRAISLATNIEQEIRIERKGQAIPAQSAIMPNTTGYDPNFKGDGYDPARRARCSTCTATSIAMATAGARGLTALRW